MIVYDLSCPLAHHFEGWYESSDTFEKLKEQGLIECPTCHSKEINRLPSAPFIASSPSKDESITSKSQPESSQGVTNSIAAKGDFMEILRQQIVQLINTNTEDVGSLFAETAKKIHYQEIPEKNIRGIATVDELQELQEEGIEILVIGNTDSSEVQH
jgi:hypothetical protein